MNERLVFFNRSSGIFNYDRIRGKYIDSFGSETVVLREYMTDHRGLASRIGQLDINVLRFQRLSDFTFHDRFPFILCFGFLDPDLKYSFIVRTVFKCSDRFAAVWIDDVTVRHSDFDLFVFFLLRGSFKQHMDVIRQMGDHGCLQTFWDIGEPVRDFFVIFHFEVIVVVGEFQFDDLSFDVFTDIAVNDPFRFHHDER